MFDHLNFAYRAKFAFTYFKFYLNFPPNLFLFFLDRKLIWKV